MAGCKRAAKRRATRYRSFVCERLARNPSEKFGRCMRQAAPGNSGKSHRTERPDKTRGSGRRGESSRKEVQNRRRRQITLLEAHKRQSKDAVVRIPVDEIVTVKVNRVCARGEDARTRVLVGKRLDERACIERQVLSTNSKANKFEFNWRNEEHGSSSLRNELT
jgi:hypothetical protein